MPGPVACPGRQSISLYEELATAAVAHCPISAGSVEDGQPPMKGMAG